MKNSNPFSLMFGKEPKAVIDRNEQVKVIEDAFLSSNPVSQVFLITGVRGTGKTVLLSSISKRFEQLDDWIVVELNPELDMLESLASEIYEKSHMKFRFAKKELSFSFNGLSFSISGDTPVSNVSTLLEKMLHILERQGKKVFIAIDEVSNNKNMKVFAQQYQIFTRHDCPLFLLMTGLYENIKGLLDEKTLTFLYRAPTIQLESLSKQDIAYSFEKILNVDRTSAIELAKLTKGYAFAYQVLGFLCFENSYSSINESLIIEYDRLLSKYVYEKIWSDLPTAEKEIVIALAKSKTQTTKEVMELISVNKETFSPYRSKLLNKGILIAPKWGVLDFSLPRFKEFVLNALLFEDF